MAEIGYGKAVLQFLRQDLFSFASRLKLYSTNQSTKIELLVFWRILELPNSLFKPRPAVFCAFDLLEQTYRAITSL